jgi:hypothetical protein
LSFRWGFIGFVDNQINMADPKSEDQEEFFFERRKMMLEAEHNQVTTMDVRRRVSKAVEDSRRLPALRADDSRNGRKALWGFNRTFVCL